MLNCSGKNQQLNPLLPGVAKVAKNLTRVLNDPERSGFEVTCIFDKGLMTVCKVIAKTCSESGPDDILLTYYGGTSVCDVHGSLQLPVGDSDHGYPMATCIESEFILPQMRQSRYQRFVLIVDGCHSGALFRNNRGIPDGLIALTSCSAEEVSGDTPLTQSLLRALNSCRADNNHNGCVTVDDGYDLIGQDKTPMAFVTYPQKWVWNLSEPILQIRSSLRVFLSYSRADSQIADRLV